MYTFGPIMARRKGGYFWHTQKIHDWREQYDNSNKCHGTCMHIQVPDSIISAHYLVLLWDVIHHHCGDRPNSMEPCKSHLQSGVRHVYGSA